MLPFPRVVFAAPSRKATSQSRERVKTARKSSAAQEINRPLRTGTGAFAAFDYPLAFKRKESRRLLQNFAAAEQSEMEPGSWRGSSGVRGGVEG